MDVQKLININAPVVLLKMLLNGHLAVIDAKNTLRIFDSKNFKVLGGFKSNITHERPISSHVDVALDGRYSISVIPGSNKAALFNVYKKELLYRIGKHQGEIESVAIDPHSRYCITCGQDGKVFVWVLQTEHLAFSLPAHSDSITSVVFSDDGHWVATGSYDRTINFFNISTMKNPVKLYGHSSMIVSIAFLPKGRLISAEKEGGLIVWDVHTGKIIYRLPKMHDEITAMAISSDNRFAFLGTKPGYIGLYDLEKMELLKQRYIKINEPITSIAFLSDLFHLAVGTAEGNLRIYSLFDDQNHFMHMIGDRDFKKFYEALEDNPMLLYSKPYDTAEKIWKNTLSKGREYLENKEGEKAKTLFEPFFDIPKKKPVITQILRDYEKYPLFETYIQEGRFPLAYSMAKQYPSFKESKPYLKMEMRWKTLFAKAQELVLEQNTDDQAREILAPFRGISEKSVLIQQLFEQRKMYDYFKKVIAQRDFVKFLYLVKMHPFLKEFPEYNAVMEFIDKLYIQAQNEYMADDYANVKKHCEILAIFPDYAEEAHEMLDAMKVKHLFYDAIKSNNLTNAFYYLNLYPLLYEMPEGQALEEHWNMIVDKAQRYAAQGMPKAITDIFEPYRTIKEKYSAMGAVYAQAYSVQLEDKISENISIETIESGIRHYIAMFGTDDMILQVYERYKRVYASQMDLVILPQGSLASWSPSLVVNDITEGNER